MAVCKRKGKFGVVTFKRHKYSPVESKMRSANKCKACGHEKKEAPARTA